MKRWTQRSIVQEELMPKDAQSGSYQTGLSQVDITYSLHIENGYACCFCVNYRKLNAEIVSDFYNIHRMDECIDSLGDATIFSN